jgi:ribosomal protein S30
MAKHINRPNFNDAKMLLRQYAKEHAVAIPKSFECILEVLNSEYNHSQLTDSRVDDIKTFNGKGSRNQPPSIRSSRHNNLKSRSRGVGNYQSGVSQADSRSQKSLQQ